MFDNAAHLTPKKVGKAAKAAKVNVILITLLLTAHHP